MSEQFHLSENVDTAALAAERTAALEAAQAERSDLQAEISPEKIRSAELVAFLAENYPECAEPELAAAACAERETLMRGVMGPSFDITTNSAVLSMVVNEFAQVSERVQADEHLVTTEMIAEASLQNRNELAAQAIAVNAAVNPDAPLAIQAELSMAGVINTSEPNPSLVVLASAQSEARTELANEEATAQTDLVAVQTEVVFEQARAQSEAGRAQSEAGRAQSEAGRAQTEVGRAQTEAGRAQVSAADVVQETRLTEEDVERLTDAKLLQDKYEDLLKTKSQKDALQHLLADPESTPEHKDRIAQILGNISTLENALPGKSEAVARFIESSNLDLGAANQAQVFADVFTNMEASGEFTAEEVETLRAAVGAGEAEIKTGSDINNALEDGAGTDEAGNRIPYTAENPLEPRPNTKIYEEPGGERTVEINVGGDIIKTRVGADILGNDMGKVVNTMLVLQVAETMGLNNVFFQKGFNQLGGGAPIRIDYDDIDDAQQVMTAFLGGGTGFNGDVMAENETERLEKNFQWLRRGEVSGDGGTDDNDSGKAIADLQTLGILDAGGALDTNKLAAAGQFIQLNAGTSTSRFEQLRTFLQGGESTTVAGTMV